MTRSGDWLLWIVESNRTKEKIDSFARLPKGWHYGKGEPIGLETRLLASDLQGRLLRAGFMQTDAFPGEDGEIQLTAYHDQHLVSIMIEPPGVMTLSHQIDGVDLFEPVVTADRSQIERKLRSITGAIWNIYDSSTPKTLITDEGASRRLPSSAQLATGAHPF